MGSVLVAALFGTVTVLAGPTTADAADGPPTNTAPPGIVGVVAVGKTVTADPGTWDPADVTYAYTWFVDGQQAGTGEQYTPTAADETHALSVEVVASQPGSPDGTATSEPVTVLGAAPQNLEGPVVSGGSLPGGIVQVTDGTWDAEGLTFSYEWRRGGELIAGATGSSYTLTRADWCQELSVVVTAHEAGHAPGVVASDVYQTSCMVDWDYPVPVSVQIHVPEHVTTQDRAQIRVRIESAGNVNPSTGTVTLRVTSMKHRVHARWVHTARLHPDDPSRVTFRLPRLAPSKYRVAARYDRAPGSQFMDGDNVETFKVGQAR